MSRSEICCVSTSIVRPSAAAASGNSKTAQRIDLAAWDLQCLQSQYLHNGLLFTKPKQEDIDMIINNLKISLSNTLDHFYPLAGRLNVTKHDDDNTISFYIDCNSTGVKFIHASTDDIAISDVLAQAYVPRTLLGSLFSLEEVMNYEGQSRPLLSVQVTELKDGIFIACSFNHVICDGTSLWHFLNSWSEISRGGSSDHIISRLPILKRWSLNDTDFPIRLPFSCSEELIVEKQIPPAQCEARVFHFTAESIARIKTKVNSEIQTGNPNISSLKALLAHIWVAVTRARCLDPNEETRCIVVVGSRARLNPPLPEEYFGNAIDAGIGSAKAGELLNKGLGWGASLLNEAIISRNDAAIRSSVKSWMEKPNFSNIMNNKWMSNIIMVGGSSRFNMYGNDFGWGRPIAVPTGISYKLDGMTTLSPGRIEGSIDIEIVLPLEKLKVMEANVEFMETVDTLLPPPF